MGSSSTSVTTNSEPFSAGPYAVEAEPSEGRRVVAETEFWFITAPESNIDPSDEDDANARLLAAAPAMNLILRLVQSGAARFDPSTREFCFNGLQFGATSREWTRILNAVGWDRARAALARAETSDV